MKFLYKPRNQSSKGEKKKKKNIDNASVQE